MVLPLRYEKWQKDKLDKIFRVANDIKNNLIAYEEKQYKQLIRRKDWRENQKRLSEAYRENPRNPDKIKALCNVRNDILYNAGFYKFGFEKTAKKYAQHYARPGHQNSSKKSNTRRRKTTMRRTQHLVPSQVVQNIAHEVWSAYWSLLYNNGNLVHFSKWINFKSITARNNTTGVVFKDNAVKIHKMIIPVKRNKDDKYGYETAAFQNKIVYCSIIRRWYPDGFRYFIRIVFEGKPPIKINPDTGQPLHPLGYGPVGHDIGTQTLASCGLHDVQLVELADKTPKLDAKIRRLNRAMDRSLRAMNPWAYDSVGNRLPLNQIPDEHKTKYGKRKWVKSKRYLRLEAQYRAIYRKLHEARLLQHYELANKLLSFGNKHYIETMRFKSLMRRAKKTEKNEKGRYKRKKRYGKSITNKAPATLVNALETRVLRSGGEFHRVNTYKLRASQFNHMTETFTKKSLSTRWNTMPDGKRIQRDMYSAFLIMNVNDTLDAANIQACDATYDNFIVLHDLEVKRLHHISTPTSTGC